MMESTARFSDKVENYIKFRPGYPPEVLESLRAKTGLTAQSVVADVGSGTGILTELFLKDGNKVIAVEPNREMREAAERLLAGYPNLESLGATAEDTGIASGSVDLIVAGQAFHWFDPDKAKAEFIRILKPGGWVALIWNDRRITASPFLEAYENLLKTFGTDYEAVNHTRIDDRILSAFFAPQTYECFSFFNRQVFDLEGLRGRLLSCSYVPREHESAFELMMAALNELFEKHQHEGVVHFDYDTKVYLGKLGSRE